MNVSYSDIRSFFTNKKHTSKSEEYNSYIAFLFTLKKYYLPNYDSNLKYYICQNLSIQKLNK